MHVTSWEDVTPPWISSTSGVGVAVVTLPNFPGIKKLSADDRQSIVDTAHAVGIEPDWLATIINFETGGTFSTTQKNAAGSGATGLIQFMPDVAQHLLGTDTPSEAITKLESMSFPEQMKVVEKYFAPHAGKMKSLSDAYLAVIYPAFIEAPDSAVMGKTGSAVYAQNRGFDKQNKGYITKADITSAINSTLESAGGKIATGISLVRPKIRTILTGAAIVAATGAVAWGVMFLINRPAPASRRVPAPAGA